MRAFTFAATEPLDTEMRVNCSIQVRHASLKKKAVTCQNSVSTRVAWAGNAEQFADWEEGLWRQPGAPGGAVGASASRDRGWRLTSGILLAFLWSIMSVGQLCSDIIVLYVSEVLKSASVAPVV